MIHANLRVRNGELAGQDLPLPESAAVLIGRAASNGVVLPHRAVSPVHCLLVPTLGDDSFTLIDAWTDGGTQVNGQPFAKGTLNVDDVVSIGPVELELTRADGPSATAPTAPRGRGVLYQLVPRGGGPGTWPLTGGTTTIVGRSPHANVWLHDDYTSEYHCLIALDPSDQGRLPHLIDLRSSNGTRVNGRPVRHYHISPGDVVTIGHTDFEVHDAPRPRDGRRRANVKLFTPADEQVVMPQSILPALAERMAEQRAALMAGATTSDSPRPRPQPRRGTAGLYPGSAGQPFGLTADPDCLFTGRQHREAIDTLIDWLGTRHPLAAIEGEPGTGKSLLLACLERHLSYLRPRPVVLRPSPARLSLDELTTSVVEAAAEQHKRIPTWGSSAKALWESAVTEFRKRKILVALLFDEADSIEPERLRALTGLVDSPAACTVTHVVLAGGAPVSELANTPPLAEHLGACCHLAPLPLDEVAPYITHRLRAMTGRRERMFTRHALKLIAAYSRGVPRLINLVAGAALFAADRARVPQVTSDLVSRTIRDALGDEVPTVSD